MQLIPIYQTDVILFRFFMLTTNSHLSNWRDLISLFSVFSWRRDCFSERWPYIHPPASLVAIAIDQLQDSSKFVIRITLKIGGDLMRGAP